MKFGNLLNKVNLFYKLAGEIQLPDKITKDIEEIMVGKCANLLYEKLNEAQQIRKTRAEKASDFKDSFVKAKNLINELRNGNIPENITIELPEFISLKDLRSGSWGYFTDDDHMKIEVLKSEDDKYFFSFYSKGYDRNVYFHSYEMGEDYIPKKQLLELLSTHKEEVDASMELAEREAGIIEADPAQDAQKIILAKAFCKKHLIEDVSLYSIPINQLPYYKGQEIPHKTISIGLNLNNVNTRVLNSKGTWDFIEITKENNIIGKVTVTRSISALLLDMFYKEDIIKYLNDFFDDVRRTTRHELRHFTQAYIRYINNLKELGGLPSRNIRDPKRDPLGFSNQDLSLNPSSHSLRDIEFYTRLSDEIHYFKKYKTNLPTDMHRFLILIWIGQIDRQVLIEKVMDMLVQKIREQKPNEEYIPSSIYAFIDKHNPSQLREMEKLFKMLPREFFQKLKKQQPEKYQKAVKEFIKAVM